MKIKNKLIRSSFILSLAAPACVAIAACCTTLSLKNDKVEANVNDQTTKSTTNNVSVNAAAKTQVRFKVKDGVTGVTFEGGTVVTAKVKRPFSSIPHPIAMKDGHPQNYWVNENNVIVKDSDEITENMVVYPYFEADVSLKNCVTLVALEHSMVTLSNFGDNAPNLKYSANGYDWNDVEPNTTYSINPGEALYLKGDNKTGFNQSLEKYSNISIAGTVNLSGNIMSLLDDGQGTTKKIPNDYCFARLFENSTGVRVISSNFLPVTDQTEADAPSTGLTKYCYQSMFKGCTSLQDFPSYLLPSTILTEGCYREMFAGCTDITTVSPNLLRGGTGTNGALAPYCYTQMFKGCTKITTIDASSAEILPAKTLAKNCYSGMFQECSELTTIIEGDGATSTTKFLPATQVAPYAYYGMFSSCTKLATVPSDIVSEDKDLSGAEYCYYSMFYNCVKLASAPTLPATVLSEGCYCSMFYNCSTLTTCPALNVTLLAPNESVTTIPDAKYCYSYMFYGCEGITTIPSLPATTLSEGCYQDMFYNCTKINSTTAWTLGATTLTPYCYDNMFTNCTTLSKTPTISATTLAAYCCRSMFNGCKGLTSAPALPATKAEVGCYRYMFADCSGITTIGNIALTSLADYACYLMFSHCSSVEIVTSGGTTFFTCPDTDGLTDPVRNMFQYTKNHNYGYPATAGTIYRYS